MQAVDGLSHDTVTALRSASVPRAADLCVVDFP